MRSEVKERLDGAMKRMRLTGVGETRGKPGTLYLTVDIGATKTLIALFNRRGRVVKKVRFPTAQGHKTFVTTLVSELKPFCRRRIRAVVVAVPGIVQKNCSVRFGNRNWGDFELLPPLKKLFTCPIFLENDGNLGALYEAEGLSGRVVYLTFSTGVGGGVVDDGRLVTEKFEPGHQTYIYRGRTAEWEDLASASALERIYHVDRATDLKSKEELADIAARVYLGLPDIAREYNPQVMVLGGPLGKIFRLYQRYLPSLPGVEYRGPKRATESVIYGAYLYASRKCSENAYNVWQNDSKMIAKRRRKAAEGPKIVLPGDERA